MRDCRTRESNTVQHNLLTKKVALKTTIKTAALSLNSRSCSYICTVYMWLSVGSKSDWVAPVVQRHWSAGHFHVHSGHREVLTLLLKRVAAAVQEHLSYFLSKVGVEEAVDYGVDAGGRHGQQVAKREEQVVVANGQSLQVPVGHHVEDGERQPAKSKDGYEDHQHDVNSAAVRHAMVFWGPGTVQHFFAPA